MRRGVGQRIFLILIRKVSFIKYIDLVSSFIIKYTDLESSFIKKKLLHKNQDAAEEPAQTVTGWYLTLKNATFILRRISELGIDLLGPTQKFLFFFFLALLPAHRVWPEDLSKKSLNFPASLEPNGCFWELLWSWQEQGASHPTPCLSRANKTFLFQRRRY